MNVLSSKTIVWSISCLKVIYIIEICLSIGGHLAGVMVHSIQHTYGRSPDDILSFRTGERAYL
jgi:hypothetical protein